MEKKIFFNWVIPLSLTSGFFIFVLITIFFLIPVFHSAKWIIWGTFILGSLLSSIVLTLVSPLILIIHGDTATFIGIPWVFRIKRERVKGVVIKNYGFEFLPINPKDYHWIYTYKEGEFKGYKKLTFGNLKAWGELMGFLWPVAEGININWDVMKDKEKNYILKRIEELKEAGELKHDTMP